MEGLSSQELHDRVLLGEVGWFLACRETVNRVRRGQFRGDCGVSSYSLGHALCLMADRGFKFTVFEQGVRALLEVKDLAWQEGGAGDTMGIRWAWRILSDAHRRDAAKLLVDLGWYTNLDLDERNALEDAHPKLIQYCAEVLP